MASQSTLYNNNTKESFLENIFRRLVKLISLELSPFFNLNQKWLKIAQDFSHISTCFFAPQSPFFVVAITYKTSFLSSCYFVAVM